MQNKKTAWFLLLTLSVIWGTSFILIKRGLVSFTPIQITCIRVIAAATILLIPAIKNRKIINSTNAVYIIISGFVGSFVPSMLFAIAQTKLPSAISGVLNSLTPLFVAIIASIWFGFQLTRKIKIGLFFAFSGSLFLSFGQEATEGGFVLKYVLLIVLACVFYAINLNLVKYKLKEVSSIAISSLSLNLVMLPAIIVLFNTDFLQVLVNDTKGIVSFGYVILLGVFSTGVALVLFNRLLKMSSPTFAGSVAYIIPVVAILFGLLDGESLHYTQILGMSMVFLGVIMINR